MYYTHVTRQSTNNPPGVRKTLLIAPLSWFNVIQSPSNAGSTIGDTIVTSSAHTFVTGTPTKGFVQIYTTDGTGSASVKQVGERDSKGVTGTFEGWHPGLNIQLMEMMAQDDEFMILIGDPDCGVDTYLQYGDRCNPCYMKDWEYTTGQKGGNGKRGIKMMFDWYGPKPAIHQATPTIHAQS